MRQTVLIRDLFWFCHPCWSFALGGCDFASSTTLRTNLPKSASHSNALLFVTCPACAYGQLMTMSRGFLVCPAAGAATGAGMGEMTHGGRWVEHPPLHHVQCTSKLEQHCWEWILLHVGFLFYIVWPHKRNCRCQSSFTGRCLKVPICLYCAGWSAKATKVF